MGSLTRGRKLALAAACACAGAAFAFDGTTSGYEQWAGIPAHPAVVNPVGGQDPANVISLRGEWYFREMFYEVHRHPYWGDMWRRTNSFVKVNGGAWSTKIEDMKTIRVPGVWEAQGVGKPGEMSVPWVCNWDDNRIRLKNKFQGEGWYGKFVKFPEAWRGKRIWLKFGGAHGQAWIWVNGNQVAWNNCYCGSYKYEITPFAKFGDKENYVAIQVTNARSSRRGQDESMHRWGGIHRDVEIEATPEVLIDDAWVRGLFDAKAAEVHVTVDGAAAAAPQYAVRVTVEGETVETKASPMGEVAVKVPLRDFRPWSTDHPNLYWAKIELLKSGEPIHVRRERFGVRKLECRGDQVFLNNKPFFLRGFGDDSAYPITGVSPADREYHLKHLKQAAAAGFNGTRLHTHCENPEYFEAADEAGILIQAELPYYSTVPCCGGDFDPERDVTELYRHFRRYPSFGIYSMGNEGSYGHDFDSRMHTLVKKMDPDRIKINQDTDALGISTPDVSDIQGGPINVWKRNEKLKDRTSPCFAHEYLNLSIKTDTRLEPKFTGAWMAPVPRAQRAKWLAKSGLTHAWGDRLQDAQHLLQRHYQKAGVESARLDRHVDGFFFWTLVDVTVYAPDFDTYSAQGLFNIFWEPKRKGYTPVEFRAFNSPECVYVGNLAPANAGVPSTNYIHVSGERFPLDFHFSHYGERPYAETELTWEITADGRRLAGGRETVRDVALGPVRPVATVTVTTPEVTRPTKALLRARMGASENTWDLWFFPRRAAKRPVKGLAAATPELFGRLSALYDGVLPPAQAASAKAVAADWDSPEAAAAAKRGQKVLALGKLNGPKNISLGWWWMGKQVGTAFADHPALAGLPHEGALSPLMFRFFREGVKLPKAPFAEKDLVVVGEGGDACWLYMAERDGTLAVFGLDVFAPVPEATSLLDGIVDHLLK